MQYYPDPKDHIPGEECSVSRSYYKERYYPQDSKRDPMEYSDPLNIPILQEIFQQTFKKAGGVNKKNDAGEAAWTNDSNPTDCFQLFPTEIIYDILVCLPSKDVLNAKLASATFAALPLTNTFWASRFQRGFEFHCVFEAQRLQTNDSDWETMYLSVKSLQNTPSFKNRRRIWKLLLLVEELHSRLISAELKGTMSHSFFEPDAPEDNRSWNLASGVLCQPDNYFDRGCRSLFARTVDITRKVTGVFLSFARFNSTKYVSGIRFQQCNGVNSSLGYVVSDEEIELDVDGSVLSKDGCSIFGFYLAIDSRGVRALSLLASNGKVSTWVGEHEGIPKTRLLLNQGDILSLKAGFDERVDDNLDDFPLQPVETPGLTTITGFYSILSSSCGLDYLGVISEHIQKDDDPSVIPEA
ncbi:hypothetical protein VE01_03330 [Pseudogymnoascus verrucosus]|uniref:DUF7600 domain-containing protein n=1 Tax=Pseudogymnoascus verrucosus TaxID=342668 RepID=A0A1B8GSA0_9PEZI|nr:uncharacterized protein VE01_03330 [Pseudogymnoascus verrucosus]OBT98680.1 hypothetical protein VE01_03330 [Pseudogymnoascus verrucosus]